MTDIPGMILWTDDYLADTMHLTTLEHGAYLLILMAMWRNGGFLAKDSKKLAKLARLEPMNWRHVEKNIMDFMTVVETPHGELITQKRLDVELKLAATRHQNRANAGKLGGLAKALKNHKVIHSNGTASAKATLDNFNTNIKKDSSFELRQEKGNSQVYVKWDTPQWNAWEAYYRKAYDKYPQKDKRGGWYFPTEWPPGTQAPMSD